MPVTSTASAIKAGTVAHFAASTAPAGWLKCNGTTVSRTTYGALFLAIGTTYGAGDGSTTFNVPDLRGEFVRSLDDGRGVDSGRGIGTTQADDFKSHAHRMNVATNVIQSGANTSQITDWESPGNVGGNVEPLGGTETRPRNVALLACIKY